MSPGNDRAEFFALVERAVRIGALLPEPDQVDVDDPVTLVELRVMLVEFEKACAAIAAFSARARRDVPQIERTMEGG